MARQLYTSKPELERSGMVSQSAESLVDEVEVSSAPTGNKGQNDQIYTRMPLKRRENDEYHTGIS